jgi:hypothetical protein
MNLGIWGLILDIVGVILIWFFGLPPELNRSGRDTFVSLKINESEKRKAKIYDFISATALLLLILGFALQIVYSLQSQNAAKLNQEKIAESQNAAP